MTLAPVRASAVRLPTPEIYPADPAAFANRFLIRIEVETGRAPETMSAQAFRVGAIGAAAGAAPRDGTASPD